jgi:hypothetical protein
VLAEMEAEGGPRHLGSLPERAVRARQPGQRHRRGFARLRGQATARAGASARAGGSARPRLL